MTKAQKMLSEFALSKCLPYLTELPLLKPYLEQLSFVLVGSAATGLCDERSDIDIAIVCEDEVYETISRGTSWDKGRPSETEIEKLRLHYYAVTFDEIQRKLKDLDDVCLYVYGNAAILRDPGDRYATRVAKLASCDQEVRKGRIEGKLDMLLRRSRAFRHALRDKDVLTISKVCLELVTLCLKIIALLDNIAFDPRKRLFKTALRGKIGRRAESRVRALFVDMGALGQMTDTADFESFSFLQKLNEIVEMLSVEAHKQGFRVGLERPDKRHTER